MTSTVVKAGGPADLLACAQHVLGFRPRDSLVLVSLRSPRRRVGLVVRVDLADTADPQLLVALAARLRADGAVAAAVLVLSDDQGTGPGRGAARRATRPESLPHARAVRSLRSALSAEGVADDDVWLVRGDRVFSYTCAGSCCPPSGRPLGDLAATQVAAELVLAGSWVADDRQARCDAEGAALAPAGAAARRAAEAAARRFTADRDGEDAVAWWVDLLTTAARAVRAGRPAADVAAELVPPAAAGRLLGALGHTHLRDAVLISLVPDGPAVAELLAAGAPGAAARVMVLLERSGPGGVPDPDTAEAADALLRVVVRCAGTQRRAEPLAVLAWSAWWRGDGVRAALCAGLALQARSEHVLARLVLDAATSVVPPTWTAHAQAALPRTGEVRPTSSSETSAS